MCGWHVPQVQREEGGHGGAEESQNFDRERIARGIGEQHDSHGQGGVQVHGHGDGDDGGGEKRVAVLAHGQVHGGQDREGGLGHDEGPDRAAHRGERGFITRGTPGLHLDGQVQEGVTTHGGAG